MMKLISCHHIKKRPPKGGGKSDSKRRSISIKELPGPRESVDDGAVIVANLSHAPPSESLRCCQIKRNFKALSKSKIISLSLMCLIIISDFHQQQPQQPKIANKCAQSQSKFIKNEESSLSASSLATFRTWPDSNSNLVKTTTSTTTTTTTDIKTTTIRKRTRLTVLRRPEKDEVESVGQMELSEERRTCQEFGKSLPTKSFFPFGSGWLWPLKLNFGALLLPSRKPLILLAQANSDANRLYEDLMMTYNRIVLPVQNNTDRVVVKLGLKLSQLIDVNLKNQMMTTNVWLNQEWSDYKLKWDPSEYGDIEDINVPAEQIWLPDIVLYNSAEGYFAVSIMTKAKVRFDGHVTWNPPAIFRSSCQIDITYFPFDSQNCHLKFGSWTYGTKIDLRHINDRENIERGTDLSEYYQNVEWDIMQANATRNVITYICCPNDFYPDVTFNFVLRRKPLFYTVNLIAPCIAITILSFAVFYLPSDSGEKVTLTISILVSLIFFLSVLIETIPSTSLAMPLLGKYLVFTMILITVSVCATVCVLNIHFRTPSTHSMPAWVKRWCIEILPRYLFMNVPQYQSQQATNPILPEQLIYLHNQAYAAQNLQQQHQQQQQQQHSNQQQQPQQTIDINWPSAKVAAEYIKANHSSEFAGQKSNLNSSTNESANKNINLNPNSNYSPAADQSSGGFRQLDVARLDHTLEQQQTPTGSSRLPHAHSHPQHQAQPGALNISPSSLFLPYLQSEAARRLQMQRSRSSDRDRSTSEHQTSAGVSNNLAGQLPTKNSCDNNQFSPPSSHQTAPASIRHKNIQQQQQQQQNTSIDMQPLARKSSKRESSQQKGKSRSSSAKVASSGDEEKFKVVKSDRRNFIKRLFAPKQSSVIKEESSSSDVEASKRAGKPHKAHHEQAAGPVTTVINKPNLLQHDTSSSFENDYQYHSHFQARASICSTNIWRVGPSRRCSVAPTNYPTFYQPALAHLAHSSSSQQVPSPAGNATLSGLSGSCHNHTISHHHHHDNLTPSSDSSTSTPGGAIDALVKATTSKLTVPPRLDNMKQAGAPKPIPQTSLANQLAVSNNQRAASDYEKLLEAASVGPVGGHLDSRSGQEMKQLNSSFVNRIAQPLPYRVGSKQQSSVAHSSSFGNHLGQVNSQPTLTPTPPPPPPLPASPSHAPAEAPLSGFNYQDQQLTLNPMHLQQQHSQGLLMLNHGHNSRLMRRNEVSVADYQQKYSQNQRHLLNQQPNCSTQTGYHVNLRRPDNNFNQNQAGRLHVPLPLMTTHFSQHPQQHPLTVTSSTPNQAPLIYRVMPRSRSTDYRLCHHTRNGNTSNGDGLYLTDLDMTDQTAQLSRGVQSSQQPSNKLFQAQTVKGFNVIKQPPAQQQAGTKYLLEGPHTIGRALGQAYMQRLERQPTIYSLHNDIQTRPSRSFHRTYLKPLSEPQQDYSQVRCSVQNSLDNMRRSKSQTSLNRRAQFDCDQCYSQAHVVEHPKLISASEIHNVCSCDSSRAVSSRMLRGELLRTQTQQKRCCDEPTCCSAEFRCNNNNICDKPGCCFNNSIESRQQPSSQSNQRLPPISTLSLMKLIGEVDKAIQNAMFIAQHIDNLDEFESVKENWKYIAMVIDRIFLIVFLFACIVGTVTIFAMVPWSYYTTEKPIDLQLTRLMALNLTNASGIGIGEDPYSRSCRDF